MKRYYNNQREVKERQLVKVTKGLYADCYNTLYIYRNSSPLPLGKYLKWLRESEGDEAADELMEKYEAYIDETNLTLRR